MPDHLNICLMNDSFPPLLDGVANTVQNYADILTERGDKAIVVVPYYPNTVDDYDYPVLRYPSLNTTRLVGYRAGYPFSPATLEELERADLDLIHTHCPFMSTAVARTLRERVDVPLIFTYHTKFDIDIRRAISATVRSGRSSRMVTAQSTPCGTWAASPSSPCGHGGGWFSVCVPTSRPWTERPRAALSQFPACGASSPAPPAARSWRRPR